MTAGVRYIVIFSITAIAVCAGYLVIERSSSASASHPVNKVIAAFNRHNTNAAPRVLDSAAIINDLRYLASDTCEGRYPGSPGHEKAVERIVTRMREAGLDSFNNTLIQEFPARKTNNSSTGKNIVGWIKGTKHPEKYIVITAHYDHLGIEGNSTYYGASDNASGTACLLALASYFKKDPQPCSLVFVAFDREEMGLEGSYRFIEELPPPLSLPAISMNLNLDMITRNDDREIFICGIYHYPELQYVADQVRDRTTLKVLTGHDRGGGHNDWTTQSDHFAFHRKKIPFLYLGVEDHPDYHRPTDSFDKIDRASYIETCNMIVLLTKLLKP
jgi:hypothetical protein